MKKRSFLFSAMTLCISCSMVWSFAEKVSAEDGTPVNDTEVKIDEQHFPDEEFRKQVGYFDDNKDGYLDSQELAAVDRLDIWKNGYRNYIYSIKGVEYFPNLLYIDCSGNRITEIDLSKNTTLLRLSCEMNQLTSLNVSNCTNLLYLVAKTNKLTSIDVSASKNLECLNIGENELESIDISNNKKLTFLNCRSNKITDLNLNNNTKLEELDCSYNPLSGLNISRQTSLLSLYCKNIGLTALDVSLNSKLRHLCCQGNALTNLDLTSNTRIQYLSCYGNKISELDVSTIPNLVYLSANAKKENRSDDESKTSYIRLRLDGPLETQVAFIDMGKNTTLKTQPHDPSPVTPAPSGGSVGDFIDRLYNVALNRDSEKEGKAFWVKELESGNRTAGECARFFLLEAPEFMNRNLSVEDFVETLYKTFFDRESDAAGKKGWCDAIRSGKKTRSEVVNDFIESTEWCNVCASYGVKSGALYHKATVPSSNANAFATRLYTCCLGRSPEEAGLKYWGLALTNQEQTGSAAAQLFFESDEFYSFRTTNIEFVTRLYTTFMDREPEPGGIRYWVGELNKGASRRAVMAGFASSPEFTKICQKYGIARGNIDASQPAPQYKTLKDAAWEVVDQIINLAEAYDWIVEYSFGIRDTSNQYGIFVDMFRIDPEDDYWGFSALCYCVKAEVKDGVITPFMADHGLGGSIWTYEDYKESFDITYWAIEEYGRK